MADTGYKFPTNSVAGGQWSNPDNAHSDDGNAAREDRNGQAQQWNTFNLGVPGGATIEGIEIKCEGRWEDTNNIDVELSWNNGSSWTASKNMSSFGYSWTIDYAGGSADTWGRTWSASELSNSNFRVRFTKQGQDYVWMDVDYLQVKVWYTAVETPVTFFAMNF